MKLILFVVSLLTTVAAAQTFPTLSALEARIDKTDLRIHRASVFLNPYAAMQGNSYCTRLLDAWKTRYLHTEGFIGSFSRRPQTPFLVDTYFAVSSDWFKDANNRSNVKNIQIDNKQLLATFELSNPAIPRAEGFHWGFVWRFSDNGNNWHTLMCRVRNP